MAFQLDQHSTFHYHSMCNLHYRIICWSTAASQIAFLGDASRFNSPDSYVNYVGLSERRFDSGNKVSKGHISHMGNRCIRRNII